MTLDKKITDVSQVPYDGIVFVRVIYTGQDLFSSYKETASFTHNVDTYAGQSGAPVLNSSNEIVGVHSRGSVVTNNFAKKLDPLLISYLETNH